MAEGGATRLPYTPGLDGIRGLSLMVMVGFHMRISWIPGAFLVIPVFFTLSGYLITQLLVLEHRNHGRVSMSSFWGTRLRRLLPASVVCVALIALVAATTELFPGEGLRGDLVATLGYFFNWRVLGSETTYAEIFSGHLSPVHHFWSLTVEEQFYFVLPLMIVWLLARRRRWLLPVTVAAMFVASVTAGIVTDSRNLVYYGTHVRAAEALVGVLLALAFPVYRTVGDRARRVIAVASGVALAGAVAIIGWASLDDRWVYEGGLALCSLVSVPIILGVLVPGPVRRLFEQRLLVEAGKISYGLYVFHWPILVLLNPERMGFDGPGLFALRLAVIIGVGLASNHLLELPIRRRKRFVTPRLGFSAVAASLAVAVALIAVVPTRPTTVLAGVDAPDEIVDFGAETPAPAPSTVAEPGSSAAAPTTVEPEPDARVLVLGSEIGTADLVADALPPDTKVELVDRTIPTCALRPAEGGIDDCSPAGALVSLGADGEPPDVVVLGVGAAERALIEAAYARARAGQPADPETVARLELDVRLTYLSSILEVFEETPLVFVDSGERDALQQDLADVAERDVNHRLVLEAEPATLARDLGVLLEALSGNDRRTRVMVIGDSNSFAVAQGIDDVAGDRYNVVWAGGRNCPIVPLVRLRWWDGVEFDLTSCPTFDGTWSAMMSEFRPDLLIVVATGSEQSEQMYEPDGEWFTLGSERFGAVHAEEMAKLVGRADTLGTKVVFFSSPYIYGGAFENAPFSHPDRIDAWNTMMFSFVSSWPQIGVVDWAGILDRAETADGREPGSLRGDGIHMEADDIARLMQSEVLAVLEGMLDSDAA